MDERLHPPFHQEITTNYKGITFTFIAPWVYNVLLLNHIKTEIEKTLRNNQNGFQRNQFITSQILIFINSLKKYGQKILRQHYSSFISPKHLIPYTEKMELTLPVYGFSKEMVTLVMIV